MPITDEIEVRYSGGASNDDGNAALGGAMSSEVVPDATSEALFDVVTGDEGAAGDTEYRCIYVVNTHATITLLGAKVWIATQATGDTAGAIALADEGLDGTAETIADEGTAPSGPTFSAPTSKATGLTIGDLAPGKKYAIWVRRTVEADAAAQNGASFTIRVEGDTTA